MMNRSFTFLEHFLKVCLYPNDINQNKWRNEIATKLAECGRIKNTSTNKKFNPSVYRLLFTTFCSSLEELKEQVDVYYREFLEEGFKELDLSKLPFGEFSKQWLDRILTRNEDGYSYYEIGRAHV